MGGGPGKGWVACDGVSKRCLWEVGIGRCLPQGLSFEVGGCPIEVVLCNKEAPARVGVLWSGTPLKRGAFHASWAGGGGWGVIQCCFRVTTFLLTIWAVEQLGSETTGHLLTNASELYCPTAFRYPVHFVFTP